ncbi:MAG: ABC transporter permease, partial [Clostridia bacterium]|nr:ABC transporter permease [Clostridia bacterium]
MFKFALRNMAVRRTRLLLVVLSIVISAGVALLSFNISRQVSEGIVSTAAYYDMIIGPSGSATQLAMNTMFFTDEPLGTIPYDYVTELQKSGLTNAVVPFTMGDSYNGSRIVGTVPLFLEDKPLKTGEMFSDVYEAVIGSAVAEKYNLNIGDQMVTTHGLGTSGSEHAASPLMVTGILRKTDTAYDNTVFTSYRTV